ncbi:nickase [Streptococcus pneumoniae GA17371]|nr:nickase [Streptococcus pneumoniae GA17371]
MEDVEKKILYYEIYKAKKKFMKNIKRKIYSQKKHFITNIRKI